MLGTKPHEVLWRRHGKLMKKYVCEGMKVTYLTKTVTKKQKEHANTKNPGNRTKLSREEATAPFSIFEGGGKRALPKKEPGLFMTQYPTVPYCVLPYSTASYGTLL